MLLGLTLTLSLSHHVGAGAVRESLLLSVLDGLTFVLLGDTKGFNR